MVCAVTCTVLDPEENPVEGALVRFTPLSPIPIGQGGGVQLVVPTDATTDEDGVCVISVAPDDYTVLIRYPATGAWQEAFAAAVPDEATADLEDLVFVPDEDDRVYAALVAAEASAALASEMPPEDITGTTYTILLADKGKGKRTTNGSAVTITLPNNLAAGFVCGLYQFGAGQFTLVAASGATLDHPQSLTKSYAQKSFVSLWVHSNVGGAAARWSAMGDMI